MLLSRTFQSLFTIIGVVTLVFLFIHLLPGEPQDTILGDTATQEDRLLFIQRYHLDKPLYKQYYYFWKDVLNGSFGRTFQNPEVTVIDKIKNVLPYTIELAIAAVIIAWFLAIPLGLLSAYLKNNWKSNIINIVILLGLIIPNMLLGPILIRFFCIDHHWLPLPGQMSYRILSLFLPALTLGSALSAILARIIRSSVVDIINSKFVIAAKSRGIKKRSLIFKYILRNAIIPAITIGGLQLGALLSGAVVTEKIFERPGLGTLFLEAFYKRDIPIIQGTVLIIAIIYVLVNWLTDVMYILVDPRIRHSND